MGMGFRIIISHGVEKRERERGEKEAWLPSPSPSLFPSEEMAAGAASAADALAFMYLLGEPVPNAEEGGDWGGENRSGGERERCEEDHHLVPVRLCVCLRVQASAVRPSPLRPLISSSSSRLEKAGETNALLTTDRRRSFRRRGCQSRGGSGRCDGGAINGEMGQSGFEKMKRIGNKKPSEEACVTVPKIRKGAFQIIAALSSSQVHAVLV